MAITVTPEITGQVASAAFTYCYLFEPLRVDILESDLAATKIFITIELIDVANSANIKDTLLVYAEFDINPGESVKVDLMKIAQQLHEADVYKYGAYRSWTQTTLTPDDWEIWHANCMKYRLNFKITTDITTTAIEVKKFPIIGGRPFHQFTPGMDETTPINEFEYYGIQVAGITFPLPADDSDQSPRYRWGNTFSIDLTLADPNNVNATPSITGYEQALTFYPPPCAGGFLLWKSRFGGWMWWGFDQQTKNRSKSYDGRIEVGQFEAQAHHLEDSVAYVQPNYTGIKTKYTRTLKAYSLTSKELLAMQSIEASPAVYYIEELGVNPLGNAELMRVSSASAPHNTLQEGGDFTVSLASISTEMQSTK